MGPRGHTSRGQKYGLDTLFTELGEGAAAEVLVRASDSTGGSGGSTETLCPFSCDDRGSPSGGTLVDETLGVAAGKKALDAELE